MLLLVCVVRQIIKKPCELPKKEVTKKVSFLLHSTHDSFEKKIVAKTRRSCGTKYKEGKICLPVFTGGKGTIS